MTTKERTQIMDLLHRLFLLSAVTIALAAGSACTTAPNNANSPIAQTSPAASPTTSPAQAQLASVRITLPLLDALLAEQPFQRQLKDKLKLSDQQMDALKRASQDEINRLRETNAEEADGNGTDAPTRAAEQVRSILGEEKATQLATLANEYWAKGAPDENKGEDKGGAAAAEMLPGPNAVPNDTRVVVNIPAFRMDLFQNGSLVKSYKVGIGYPEFPLPFGLRKAQTIIFNPSWTPPDSPWVAKMKNAIPGETIEPGSKDNPLGPIKIPIGLPSLIHGGKSPARIGKFASHGCVGLTNAQIKDFAMLLMKAGNKQVSDKEIANYLADKTKTKSVKLDQAVPVELRYETIVLEDGKLHIYKDVYAQDTNTEENLRRVLEAQGGRLEDLSQDQRQQALDALNAMSAKPKPTASASPSPSPDKKTAKAAKKKAPQNEVVIDVSTLSGKGYPAAVNLDDGSGAKRKSNT
ncbi:MAG TPA: L,D-transpeptidase family protein [Pyrinomonadaceae bacterium]|nr:L,D-transpeptidase family protein [Pyrinomonadaceae bacterium]